MTTIPGTPPEPDAPEEPGVDPSGEPETEPPADPESNAVEPFSPDDPEAVDA